jgi:uncharacterized LabA/DUF88 family protein
VPTAIAIPQTVSQPKPPPKRAIAFVDGQNLFHSVREAFNYDYPNYHPLKLADHICGGKGWVCQQSRFYTGVPKLADNPYWHKFWAAKKRFLNRDTRNYVFTRDIRYREKGIIFDEDVSSIVLGDGSPLPVGAKLLLPSGRTEPGEIWIRAGEEKGIDVRIAIDMIRLAYRHEFDVAIIFSQDQDLSEAVAEIKQIAGEQKRTVEIHCAFPKSASTTNDVAIRGTLPIQIDRATYDACLDPSNYSRPR